MAFEAFAERDYRRFWTAQFVSNVGSWMQAIAEGWLVYRLTDSPFLLGFVGFANSLPMFFLMLPGGVVADRLNRRRDVIASQLVQTLSSVFLAVSIYTHQITVWQIIAAALANGVAMSFSSPAWQAMVVDILEDRSRLSNAVAMNSLQFQLSRAIGPLIAGLALSAYGPFWCFFFNSLSFVPLMIVLGLIKNRQIVGGASGPMVARLKEGFRYVLEQRIVLLLLAIVASASIFGYPFMTIMPMVARSMYHADDRRGLGFLMGAVGAGAGLGALLLSIRTPPRKLMTRMIIASLAIFGFSLIEVGFLRNHVLVMTCLVISGCSMVVSLALCNTSIQQRIPDAMRGRVLSMYTFAFNGFLPFGNLIAGTLAEHRGLGPTMYTLGGGVVVSAGVAAFLTRPSRAVSALPDSRRVD
jgi:MFS family permease